MSSQGQAAVKVRRASWGWRERAVLTCGNCGDPFVRLGNTRYCSDFCRFADKFEVVGQCWIWQATTDRHGYGTFYLGRNKRAHRASFELHGRSVPSGLELDHLCRNRACVRVDHLEPVTRAENIRRGARWPSRKAG